MSCLFNNVVQEKQEKRRREHKEEEPKVEGNRARKKTKIMKTNFEEEEECESNITSFESLESVPTWLQKLHS